LVQEKIILEIILNLFSKFLPIFSAENLMALEPFPNFEQLKTILRREAIPIRKHFETN